MNNHYINRMLVCLLVIGTGLAIIGYRNSTISAREAVSAAAMSSAPPSQESREASITSGKPLTISVKSRSKTLIDKAPMDQKLLTEGPRGVIPGDMPGLFIKEGISTFPASSQDGTVIVGGHAYAERPMVFNPLSDLNSTDIGNSLVTLEMPTGELRYVIEAVNIIDKIDLPMQQALADNRPGRILLITCDVRGGSDSFQNRVIVACDARHSGCGTLV